jgi:hypothetical protein
MTGDGISASIAATLGRNASSTKIPAVTKPTIRYAYKTGNGRYSFVSTPYNPVSQQLET